MHPAARAPDREDLLLMAEIERELRRLGLWESAPPSASALASALPFCCDTLRFTQWIQWVFIPHTRALAEVGGPLPSASGIRPMGEEALRGCAWDTRPLLELLGRFDHLIEEAQGGAVRQ